MSQFRLRQLSEGGKVVLYLFQLGTEFFTTIHLLGNKRPHGLGDL